MAVAGFILLFWIIPKHTETADFGWLRPETLPNITAVIIIIASVIQLVFPTGKAEFAVAPALRAGLFLGITLLGLLLMHHTGFLIAAPLLVMAVILLTGERRLLWLILGIVLLPLAIWSSIESLLNRPLP